MYYNINNGKIGIGGNLEVSVTWMIGMCEVVRCR